MIGVTGRVRVGLGCMRLADAAVLEAALAAGIAVFDTARAYADGENERLVGRTVGAGAQIVTKGGMRRPEGRWVPDGRARALRDDAAASRVALGRPADYFLLHAPDPRVPLATSVRALAAIRDAGDARAIGLSNVSRTQLEEALAVTRIDAVEVALGAFDDAPLRGGLVELCADRDVVVFAHSPLGGPRRAARLVDDAVLAALAADRGVTPAQIVLAWLCDLGVVPLPGATRTETAIAAAAAAAIVLLPRDRERLAERFVSASPPPRVAVGRGEIVLLVGIPGAGKTRAAAAWVARGWERWSRDDRGGSIRDLHAAIDERLRAGERRVLLDGTYVTRAARRDVIALAARHDLGVRCLWLDTSLADAQVNVVARILDRLGRLPDPEELRRSRDPAILSPTAVLRVRRELEPPAADEGFAALEVIPFVRASGGGVPGVFVADEIADVAVAEGGPRIRFGWRPGAPPAPGICTHPGGPPTCWCRPPLPGLALALAREQGVDPARSVLVGRSAAHRALAEALGARFVLAA